MTSTLVELPIPPVPSAQSFDTKGSMISQPWQQWFVNLRDKINVINANLIGWSGATPVSGVTPGTYGDATHYPVISVNGNGQVTNVTLEPVSSSGGVLPVVTGEIASNQPVFVYLDDGSLVYAEVA